MGPVRCGHSRMDAWFVEPGDEGVYYVRGRRVERMAAMTNPDSFEGMERLETQLRKMGVIAALREAGASLAIPSHRQDAARMGRRNVGRRMFAGYAANIAESSI